MVALGGMDWEPSAHGSDDSDANAAQGAAHASYPVRDRTHVCRLPVSLLRACSEAASLFCVRNADV